MEVIHDANEVDDDTLEDNEIDRDLIFNHIYKMSTNCQRVGLSDKDKENVDEVLNDVNENGTAHYQECLVLNGVLGQMVSNHGYDCDWFSSDEEDGLHENEHETACDHVTILPPDQGKDNANQGTNGIVQAQDCQGSLDEAIEILKVGVQNENADDCNSKAGDRTSNG